MSQDNEDRATRGRAALATYISEGFSDADSALDDLLADLMHMSAADSPNRDAFDRALETARMHFAAETEEECQHVRAPLDPQCIKCGIQLES